MDDQGDRQHTRKGPGVSCPNKTGNVVCAGINVNPIIMYLIICCHILYFVIVVYTSGKGPIPGYWVYCTAGGSLLIMLCVQGSMGCQATSPLF